MSVRRIAYKKLAILANFTEEARVMRVLNIYAHINK